MIIYIYVCSVFVFSCLLGVLELLKRVGTLSDRWRRVTTSTRDPVLVVNEF